MPKVACFQLPGLACWFWSNEHDPPHFHVKREGKWELKVKLTEGGARMFERVWGVRPDSSIPREIASNVEENRVRLLGEWEANVNQ